MDQDSVHMVAASNVPMLKPGEYGLWRMRMEQYIQMIDYSLWEVIKNDNAPPITKVVEGVKTTIAPTTAEEKAQRRDNTSLRYHFCSDQLQEIVLRVSCGVKEYTSSPQCFHSLEGIDLCCTRYLGGSFGFLCGP
ncbi:hypothetical protein Tco_1190736 [Tanacetum coccineum]